EVLLGNCDDSDDIKSFVGYNGLKMGAFENAFFVNKMNLVKSFNYFIIFTQALLLQSSYHVESHRYHNHKLNNYSYLNPESIPINDSYNFSCKSICGDGCILGLSMVILFYFGISLFIIRHYYIRRQLRRNGTIIVTTSNRIDPELGGHKRRDSDETVVNAFTRDYNGDEESTKSLLSIELFTKNAFSNAPIFNPLYPTKDLMSSLSSQLP
ncbi:6064_t:CDS:2, partial [Entrophospora sp. SA101]